MALTVRHLDNDVDVACRYLEFDGQRLLMDCGVDLNAVEEFRPKTSQARSIMAEGPALCTNRESVGAATTPRILTMKLPRLDLIDVKTLDVILISNQDNFYALPYITEHLGFQGLIYATKPSMDFGRLLVEELVHLVEAVNEDEFDPKLPLTRMEGLKNRRLLYDMHDVKNCFDKIIPLNYNELIKLPAGLSIRPISSGFSIGACNWVLRTPRGRAAYISASASSANRHPEKIDIKGYEGCEAMIVNELNSGVEENVAQMLYNVCENVFHALEKGGNAIIATKSCGCIFDLFEYIHNQMCSRQHRNVPIYFISPIAEASLKTADRYGTWLCESRRERVYHREATFQHNLLLKQNTLRVRRDLASAGDMLLEKQSIVFTSAEALRFGDISGLIESWGNQPDNVLLLTEPVDNLASYMHLPITVKHCPVNVRLSCNEANQLIATCNPRFLVLPEKYAAADRMGSRLNSVLPLDPQCGVTKYIEQYSAVEVDCKSGYCDIKVSPELARTLTPSLIGEKWGTYVHAELALQNGHYTLLPSFENKANNQTISSTAKLENTKRRASSSVHAVLPPPPATPVLFGTLNIDALLSKLQQNGFDDVRVSESSPEYCMITLPSVDGSITCRSNQTHVSIEDNAVRAKVRDLICSHLAVVS